MTRRSAAKPEFVLARAASLPKLVEGSKRVLCAKCRKHRVWATPEMIRLEMRVICPKCAPSSKKVGT